MEKEQTIANKTPLISVIVPVYKVEQFIHRCVDSILNQTYTNLEIILVDDGSPDRCGEICDEYAEKDSRIRVIHQKNGGLSAARNAGLDICTGDYIAFVDSDDYIEADMYERMLTAAIAYKVDICICQWQFETCEGKKVVDLAKVNSDIFGEMSSLVFAQFLFKGSYENGVVVAAWNKLYKKSIFNDIRFCGNYMEDDAIHSYIFSIDFPVFVMDQQYYVYCENNASLTHQGFRKESTRMLDIMAERTELFGTDSFIVRESKRTYCNLYIEYYYKAKNAGISMPNRKIFCAYIRDLVCEKACSLKFVIRILLFLVSPKLYHVFGVR